MNIFKRKYSFQGCVQFINNKLTICGDTVRWLDNITIKDFTKERAAKKAFDFFKKKYPEYKDYIQLF
jgi:hypothetical protein